MPQRPVNDLIQGELASDGLSLGAGRAVTRNRMLTRRLSAVLPCCAMTGVTGKMALILARTTTVIDDGSRGRQPLALFLR